MAQNMNQINTVLVVDDELDNFDVIEMLLLKENYHLKYIPSGSEALNTLDLIKPDVILLDVMMPEINGIEVCKQIKSHPNWRHIPIIMVTALSSKEDLARCLAAGADDFLTKPVTAIELRARVASMLRIKKQYDELEFTLNSLKAANQLRQDMSYMIVHDVRNPLSSIYTCSEILLINKLTDKQQKKVEQIFSSAQQIRSLTDDLLVMAQIESGKIKINSCDADICYLSEQLFLDFQAVAEKKKIQLVRDIPQIEKNILLDVKLFRRVLDNLLSNAIKFSPSGSQIKLQIDYPNQPEMQARVRIYDQGAGVKEEMRQCIFEKYEIGNIMSGVSQIGLGLAFCKMIIAAHGGKIFVESNYPTGSVFTVEI
jgi:two-component system, sensor histidine kinase and response regulator